MARIAIVKVRSAHDVEWKLPRSAEVSLGLLGMRHMRDQLLAASGQSFMPQLTLPYLAALGEAYNVAAGMRHRFELVDDRAERIRLSPDRYDMIWFTSVSPTAHAVYRLSDEARRRGMTTVIGGIHATMMPEEAAPHADALVLGEGETTVSELLADYDAGRLEPRYRGRPVSRLDWLPRPDWRASSLADYCPWIVPVQTSRGCRNACQFCSTTRYQGARRRHRPVAEIVDEIRWLQDEGILTDNKVIFFTDNNIVSDSDHRRGVSDTTYARSLFSALAPLGVQWCGQGEINVARDHQLTRLMARSGCILLLVGFESIQQRNLAAVGKPSNQVETYIEHIETLHQHDVALIGCFIFGLDHDGPGVFEQTWPFIDRYIDVPQISMLTPFPGTALYRQIKREGRLLHEDWSRYDITHCVHEPKGMSARELEQGFAWLNERTFSWPAMIRRCLRRAAHPRVYSHPGLTFSGRASATLAPNLIYRSLCNIGRGEQPWRGERLLRVESGTSNPLKAA